KTTLALHVVANSQRQGGAAAYIDAEHALDVEYAKKLGVDIDNLLVSQPDTGEQGLEITEMLVRSGAVDVVVIDSVAGLVPKAEFDIMFDEGISHESLLVDIAAEAGIIEKSGAWYAYGKERIGQGRENAKLYLKDHPDLAVEVEAKVKEHLGVKPAPVAADEEAAAPEE